MRIKIRKPTIKKYPKKPKGTSLKTVANFLAKVQQIDKDNKGKIAEYNRQVALSQTLVKKLQKVGKSTDILNKIKQRSQY